MYKVLGLSRDQIKRKKEKVKNPVTSGSVAHKQQPFSPSGLLSPDRPGCSLWALFVAIGHACIFSEENVHSLSENKLKFMNQAHVLNINM